MIAGVLLVVAGLVIVAWGRAHLELVAAGLTAAAILFTYYLFHQPERTYAMSTTHNMDDAQGLVITRHDDGTITVDTAPAPEYIDVSRELWEQLTVYDPAVDGDTGLEPPDEPMWLEVIGHADPEIANDGYMLHVDTENVVCSYRADSVPEEGPVRATLAAWGEK